MIWDHITNAEKYYALKEGLKEAFDYIQTITEDQEPGRFELDSGLIVMVQHVSTKGFDEVDFEAHKKYIDLQYILEGEEYVVVNDCKNLTESIPYNPEKDVLFYQGEGNTLKIQKGEFYFLFPHDAHKPCCRPEKGLPVKKIVIKIKA